MITASSRTLSAKALRSKYLIFSSVEVWIGDVASSERPNAARHCADPDEMISTARAHAKSSGTLNVLSSGSRAESSLRSEGNPESILQISWTLSGSLKSYDYA